MRNFRNWEVYTNARRFTVSMYEETKAFPDAEKFGLSSQIRRASVSIVANIAEGAGRSTDKDFKHFLNMAMGSAFESEALLELAHDLDYLPKENFESLLTELSIIQKQLNAFISRLKR